MPEDSSILHSHKLQLALREFQRSDEFKTFSDEMKACLTALQTSRFRGPCPKNKDHSEDYPKLIKNLELDYPSSGRPKYGTALFGLYSEGCLYFKQILAMLQHAQNHPKDFRPGALQDCEPLVKDFESELLVCGPGLLQKIADATTKIRNTLFPPSLAECVESTRVEIGKQHLIHELRRISDQFANFTINEVHIVKTWMDVLKGKHQLQVKEFDDHYANRREYYDSVSLRKIQRIESRFAEQVSYPNTVDHIAWATLEELKQSLSELPEEQRNNASEVESHVLTLLDQRFGNLELSTLFKPLEQSRLELHHEPSLLVAALRHKLEQESSLPYGAALKPTVFQLNGVDQLTLCNWHKSFWTEFKTSGITERALLQIDDLSNDDALKVLKAVAPQLDTQTNFIAAPYLNHPDHSQKIAPFFSGHRHPQSIATAAYLCSIANEHEAPRFASAFELLANCELITARSVIDVLTNIDFTDKQIATALKRIKTSDMPSINWSSLQSECLTGRSNILHSPVFKIITQGMSLNSQPLKKLISFYAEKGDVYNLKVIIDTFANDEYEKSGAAIHGLINQTNPQKHPKTNEYLISLIPDLKTQIRGFQNLLDYCIEHTTDDFAASIAEKWISSGGSDFCDSLGANSVCRAASTRALKTLTVLLNHKDFHVNHVNRLKFSALDHALEAINNYPVIHPDTALNICKLLLEKGALPNQSRGKAQRTWHDALHNGLPEPESTNLLKLFLRHGAKDSDDSPSSFAVNRACKSLQPEKVKTLLKYTDRFKTGQFSLHLAWDSVLVKTSYGSDELMQDTRKQIISLIQILEPTPKDLDRKDVSGRTPIDYAIECNLLEAAVEMFKQAGGLDNLNRSGLARIHKAVIRAQPQLVQLLVQAGANINLRSDNRLAGKTALHYAIQKKDVGMQTLLITLGARPQIQDGLGRTAEHYRALVNER